MIPREDKYVPHPEGIVVAPVTPMNDDLSVNYDALAADVDRLVRAGIHGLTPCAVTAEAETLSMEEHRRVLATVVAANAGRVPVYCGIGRPSLLELRELVDHVHSIGADGLFVISPYASSHSIAEVQAHYEDVAERSGLPTIIYNCPGYSGVNIPPRVSAQLAEHPMIVGIKEGQQGQLHDTVRLVDDRMAVLTARDSYLLPSLVVGATGVVSFAANVAPELHVALFDAVQKGDLALARRMHNGVCQLVEALVARSYPVLIKEGMRMQGHPVGPARRVATRIDDDERDRLRLALEATAALT
jgi:4-hydroxy-tetrahydrodipicolinate synthase